MQTLAEKFVIQGKNQKIHMSPPCLKDFTKKNRKPMTSHRTERRPSRSKNEMPSLFPNPSPRGTFGLGNTITIDVENTH